MLVSEGGGAGAVASGGNAGSRGGGGVDRHPQLKSTASATQTAADVKRSMDEALSICGLGFTDYFLADGLLSGL